MLLSCDSLSPASAIFYWWLAAGQAFGLYLLPVWKGIFNLRSKFSKVNWYLDLTIVWQAVVITTNLIMCLTPTRPTCFGSST